MAIWHRVAAADVSHISRDDALYREYTLALIWMRRVPEWITTDEISHNLRKCARENELPWDIDPDDLYWTR